jgi:hypothetical protein
MHDARTHGHIRAESSSETLRHTQVSGTETRPVNPAQNTDHELIYQRAAVSQPSMQNDVSSPITGPCHYPGKYTINVRVVKPKIEMLINHPIIV